MSGIKGKHFIIGGAILIVVALMVFAVFNAGNTNAVNTGSKSKSVTTNSLGTGTANNNLANGEYQEAILSMENWKYVVTPSTLKKGIPVRMTADTKKLVGCSADVTIRDFGVRKYVKSGDNVIEFTPTKTGTIVIACSMNMYSGSFEVIDEANPDSPAEVQATIPVSSGGSCGSGGGGCGCGGGA